MKPIPIGTVGSKTVWVTRADLASSTGSGGVDVFSTPCLVLLMEEAAVEALEEFLEEGETTVGTRICIDHMAPTPPGLKVTAEAEVMAVDGKKITLKVKAFDDVETVGEGIHERFLVLTEKFTTKAYEKLDIHKE
ncbi:MAG TPA: thioesterase family protein [Bacillota bacterium]|nr:thioesterase family protein [Candidatus Fermentithermobacillaceae bacterium]HOB30827.1 thioesterase family protein [Bacillota bacterium]HOK64606.1 thioesterase family protein [Bacillota bacterium]HOL12141.1 thioesterase family protein [Bacillota bacterium]HOQ03255.1 thioesterase family protein [Bacillota bacterium]